MSCPPPPAAAAVATANGHDDEEHDSTLFPPLTRAYMLAFQFSAWYPTYAAHSIKSTVVRPLEPAFAAYLDADGVFVPAGAEDTPAESALDDDDDDDDGEDDERTKYAFPALDARIRAAVQEYGGVFPKLNFSAPKDAAWLLPASSPLKCTSPADVYLLLKSSDFVTHDLSKDAVFAGCVSAATGRSEGETTEGDDDDDDAEEEYALELVLRKWYPVDRARELRCFVRGDRLVAISQRDTNFYPFWADAGTQRAVAAAVASFWNEVVRPRWRAQADYVLDLLLTRDLARAHIVDFNPYHPKTDTLLFTYEELHALHLAASARAPATQTTEKLSQIMGEVAQTTGEHAQTTNERPAPATSSDDPPLPVFRVIDSAAHPAANHNAPAHQHNMIPFEAASLSSGRAIDEFAERWKDSVRASMQDSDDDSDQDA